MTKPLSLQCESLNDEILLMLEKIILSGREEEKIDIKLKIDLGSELCKAEFAKDISAIANTPGASSGYIIIGVLDNKERNSDNPEDYVVGFSCDTDKFWGQVAQALSKYLTDPPGVACHTLITAEGNTITVLEIKRSLNRPHYIKRSSDSIQEHQVWIRRGPHSFTANPTELKEMIQGSKELTVINFSTHTFNDEHKEQLRRLGFGTIKEVINRPVEYDDNRAFASQTAVLIDSIELTVKQWQELPLLICLPGYSPVTAMILAHLHGLIGHFPGIVRMKPAEGIFEVAEIINLDQVRSNARKTRASS